MSVAAVAAAERAAYGTAGGGVGDVVAVAVAAGAVVVMPPHLGVGYDAHARADKTFAYAQRALLQHNDDGKSVSVCV